METFFESIIKEGVHIDFHEELRFGSDYIYAKTPMHCATVTLTLQESDILILAADRVRIRRGHRPLLPVDHRTQEDCDTQGWYDFTVNLIQMPDTVPVDNCIRFIPRETSSKDNDYHYFISLTEEEQNALYRHLNGELKNHEQKSIKQLLKEAEKKMYAEG